VVGRLKAQPVLDTRLHVGERVPLAAREREEGVDEAVEFEPRVGRRRRLRVVAELADVDAAPLAHLKPAGPFEVAEGGAHRVRVDAEAARQLARGGQALARLQVAAHHAEHDLPHELLAQGHAAVLGEPQAHKRRREFKVRARKLEAFSTTECPRTG
jgi:hypothetical protein